MESFSPVDLIWGFGGTVATLVIAAFATRLWGRFAISLLCGAAGIYGHAYVYGHRAALLEAHRLASHAGEVEVMKGVQALLHSPWVDITTAVMAIGGAVGAIAFGLQLGSGRETSSG